ncbi:MAG: hypothetical protein Q9191_006607, partial [Dirinaria sp. TL-2023a]
MVNGWWCHVCPLANRRRMWMSYHKTQCTACGHLVCNLCLWDDIGKVTASSRSHQHHSQQGPSNRRHGGGGRDIPNITTTSSLDEDLSRLFPDDFPTNIPIPSSSTGQQQYTLAEPSNLVPATQKQEEEEGAHPCQGEEGVCWLGDIEMKK